MFMIRQGINNNGLEKKADSPAFYLMKQDLFKGIFELTENRTRIP
mgnify:CR=1 FL=1